MLKEQPLWTSKGGEEDILMKSKYHSETVQTKYPHRRRFDPKIVLCCEDEQLITILIHLEKDIYIWIYTL